MTTPQGTMRIDHALMWSRPISGICCSIISLICRAKWFGMGISGTLLCSCLRVACAAAPSSSPLQTPTIHHYTWHVIRYYRLIICAQNFEGGNVPSISALENMLPVHQELAHSQTADWLDRGALCQSPHPFCRGQVHACLPTAIQSHRVQHLLQRNADYVNLPQQADNIPENYSVQFLS